MSEKPEPQTTNGRSKMLLFGAIATTFMAAIWWTLWFIGDAAFSYSLIDPNNVPAGYIMQSQGEGKELKWVKAP